MKRCLCVIMILLWITVSMAQPKLLIRCDDIGMCHSVNVAMEKLIETGIPFSASAMFCCPWIEEAVEILKAHPEVGVGVHLTLNSEWKHYKWSPLSGSTVVPTLVDGQGYFWTSEILFHAQEINLKEVETELRAQIDRAFGTGLRIDYLDYHMGTAISTPELRAIVERLAREYGLGISGYFGEVYQTVWGIPPDQKLSQLLALIDELQNDRIHLIVIHLGMENPEMNALIDMNNPNDPYPVSRHRQAELDALLSKPFRTALEKNRIRVMTYHNVVKKKERPK